VDGCGVGGACTTTAAATTAGIRGHLLLLIYPRSCDSLLFVWCFADLRIFAFVTAAPAGSYSAYGTTVAAGLGVWLRTPCCRDIAATPVRSLHDLRCAGTRVARRAGLCLPGLDTIRCSGGLKFRLAFGIPAVLRRRVLVVILPYTRLLVPRRKISVRSCFCVLNTMFVVRCTAANSHRCHSLPLYRLLVAIYHHYRTTYVATPGGAGLLPYAVACRTFAVPRRRG